MIHILLLLLPPQVPAPPPVPPIVKQTTVIPKQTQWQQYMILRTRAIKENVPLVVGVGIYPTVPLGNYLSCRCDTSFGPPGIVIGLPKNGDLIRIDLPLNATVSEIRAAVEGRQRQVPSPFADVESFQSRSVIKRRRY